MTTTTMKKEKAYLVLVAPSKNGNSPPRLGEVLDKSKTGGEGEVKFEFNPKEFSISKKANWERKNQPNAPRSAMPQFTGTSPASMTLEIFLDASEDEDPKITAKVQQLLDCVIPLEKTRQDKKPSPPWVVFGWGKFVNFVALVQEVKAQYTMFRADGLPIRATCTLTLEELPTDPPLRQNPTSGGLTAHRTHRVIAGDTLPSIAHREYGNPALWRGLAIANDIDDPHRIPPGVELLVPTADDLPEPS